MHTNNRINLLKIVKSDMLITKCIYNYEMKVDCTKIF